MKKIFTSHDYTIKASFFRRCLVVVFTAPYARPMKNFLFPHRSGSFFRLRRLAALCLAVLFLAGCGTAIRTPKFLDKLLLQKTNSRYYEKKVYRVVKQLVEQMEDETMNYRVKKIAVLDIVDRTGRVPELGRYISLKIVQEISINNYYKLAPRADLMNTMERLNTGFNDFDFTLSKKIGNALQIEAIIAGKIIDLGTNLDLTVNTIDVKNGEIIASASESLDRSGFATEMLRRY